MHPAMLVAKKCPGNLLVRGIVLYALSQECFR